MADNRHMLPKLGIKNNQIWNLESNKWFKKKKKDKFE